MAKKDKKNKKKNNKLFLSYPSKEKDYFVENLSMLISSGMGVLAALNITKEELKSKSLKKIVAEIIRQVENGTSLWRAVDGSGLFSGYFISLLKIGEESGRLEENLKIIAVQSEKDKMFTSKIRSAIMYPVFVMGLAAFIALAIAWFILPKLASVFVHLKMELPAVTKALINTGIFLADNGSWAIPGVTLLLVLIIFFLFVFPKTKFLGRSLLFNFPGSKKVIQQVEVARCGFILGTLLKAGLPVNTAFDSLVQATEFPTYRRFFKHLHVQIEQGIGFQEAFSSYRKSHKLVPRSIQKMINSGQQSGNLSDILIKVSENMEAKTEITAKNLSVILEPILLVIVWVGVVGVALAVILPIYSLVGGLNDERNKTSSSPPPPPPPIVQEVNIIEPELEIIEPEYVPEEPLPQVLISETELGYLNVRDRSDINSNIINRAAPGDIYEYLSLVNNWYEIVLDDGSTGWVFGTYLTEVEYE